LNETLAAVRRLDLDLVSMDEAIRRLAEGGAPFATLTFDDGYRDLVEHALPVLERYTAPFTAYVATGFAERTARLSWLELEEALRRLDRVDLTGRGRSIRLPTATMAENTAAFAQIYWALRGG